MILEPGAVFAGILLFGPVLYILASGPEKQGDDDAT